MLNFDFLIFFFLNEVFFKSKINFENLLKIKKKKC